MRPKSILLLTLALGCGLVASIGISQVLENRNAPVQTNPDLAPVFVAMTDIAPHEALTPQNIKLEEWPKDKIAPDAITKLSDVEGKRCKVRLLAGEQIRAPRVIGMGEAAGASEGIPKGYRVVAVRVDAVSGSASLIMPGDRVDVLAYMGKNPAHGITETTTKTILQDISVFAVDTTTTDELAKNGKEEKAIAAKTVSLLVTPAQAQAVTLASELGSLRLVMRSPEDSGGDDAPDETTVSTLDRKKSDRKAEEEGLAETEPTKAGQATGEPLNKFINSAIATLPTNSPTVSPPQPQSWKMVLMEGSNIREVQLAGDGVIFADVTPPSPLPPTTPAADDPALPPPSESGPKIESITPAVPLPTIPSPTLTTPQVEPSIEPLPATDKPAETAPNTEPETTTEDPSTNKGE